jgi:ATP-dependent helicase HepA
VPAGLDALNEHVVSAACERLGLGAERRRGPRTWSIEFGNEALVDHLPGVAGGASFLGTFDRETAVADESLDFFAAGHPLVEGILAHLDESALGRVCALHVSLGGARGLGLLALYRDAAGFSAVAVDEGGQARPEWARALLEPPLRARPAPAALSDPRWTARVRRLAAALDPSRQPVALAALVIDG